MHSREGPLNSQRLRPRHCGCLVGSTSIIASNNPAGTSNHCFFADSVRQAVLAALSAADLLAPGQRVWLRPRQLPVPFQLGVPDAIQALRCAPGALLAVHGVVTAASALFQQTVSRAFECAVCARVCTLHSTGTPPPCCGGVFRELEQARVMVPVSGQVVLNIS